MADNIISSMRLSDGSYIKLEYHDSLKSTALLAKEYAKSGYPDKYVVLTDKQSSSAITKTKLSDGEYEEGVFFSIILRPSFFPSQVGQLGPLCATALLTALEGYTKFPLGISWVSDVYCNGKRIGGSTIEGKLDNYSTFEYMIVSFAVKSDAELFPPKLNDIIQKVFESDNQSVGMILAKAIINRFFAVYQDIKNPEKHISLYKRKFALSGNRIKYLSGDKKYSCKVVDINLQNFSLICERSSGHRFEITSPSSVVIPKKIKFNFIHTSSQSS